MVKTIPKNLKLFDCIKYFSIDQCINIYRAKRINFECLSLELLDTDTDLSVLEKQYNNVINVPFDIVRF